MLRGLLKVAVVVVFAMLVLFGRCDRAMRWYVCNEMDGGMWRKLGDW